MSNRDIIRRARLEQEKGIVQAQMGNLHAHHHRVNERHMPGQYIEDTAGEVVMMDVIKHAQEGDMQKAIDSLAVYLAKYKEKNKFL